MMQILTPPQILQFIDTTTGGWIYEAGVLRTTYEFTDFLEAVSFVNDVAEVAEQFAHHPDIVISYNKVTLTTVTHDVGDQITERDIALIEAIEELLE